MEVDRSLADALQNWQRGHASREQTRTLASDLGNRHYEPGIPTLMQLLGHEDEIVRYNAANSLAFEFHYVPASQELLTMLARDGDADCRRVAAAALGNLLQNKNEPRILAALAESALTDPDEYVRSSAYKALQIVHGVSRDEHLRLLRQERLAVDSSRVFAILGQAKR